MRRDAGCRADAAREIARLENVKGAKSQLRGAAAIPATQDKDIGQLKNQVRCLKRQLIDN